MSWPREKRWDYWAVMSPRELVMVLLADVDYLGVALVSLLDLESGARRESVAVRPLAIGCRLPASFGPLSFRGRPSIEIAPSERAIAIRASSPKLAVDLLVEPPADFEPLDVTVPFGGGRAHFTSKRVGLPASGRLIVDGASRPLAGPAYATLDFGRGRWPWRTRWNWAAAAGRVQNRTVAINLGAQWTDGSGVTENGVWVDGRLHRIEEDVTFTRDGRGWKIRSPSLALAFAPIQKRDVGMQLGLVGARLDWSAGRFAGEISIGGAQIRADGLTGWVEELDAKW